MASHKVGYSLMIHLCTHMCFCPTCPPQIDIMGNRTDHLRSVTGERRDEGYAMYDECPRCGFRRYTGKVTFAVTSPSSSVRVDW